MTLRGHARALAAAALLFASPAAGQEAFTAQYEAAFLADPTYGALFTEMKAGYPAQWKEMITESARRLASGMPPAEVDAYRRDFLQKFNASLRPDMKRAPASLLADYARANAEFMTQLRREDVGACVAIVTQKPLAPEATARFGEATRKALIKSQIATLRAARAGAASPVQHGPPTRADDAAVSLAMTAAGGIAADVGKIANPASDLTPRQRCDAGTGWSIAMTKTSNTIIARELNR